MTDRQQDHAAVLREIRDACAQNGGVAKIEFGKVAGDTFIAALDYALALSETLRNWGIRRKEGGGDPMLLICHAEHGGVGVSERPEEARIIPEAMLFLLARDLMQADTTGGQS